MLLYVLNGIYLCVWAILLVHCLRSKRVYPIFGNGWVTKAFWLFTFIFFNPLLSFLYILCIFCPFINKRWIESVRQGTDAQIRSPRSIAIPLFFFFYTCMVLVLFEVPRTMAENPSSVILNRTNGTSSAMEKSLLRSGANIGLVDAKNKIQTVSSNSASDDMKVNLRNIMLICKNNNHFLDMVALKMQKSLVSLPYVDSVSYYFYGNQPEPGRILPDVFITLEMPELIEDRFLLNREMKVKINCAASSSISEVLSDAADNTSTGPIVPFKIQSELQHTGRSLCIECPGTEYEQEAKNISGKLLEAFEKQFENLLDKYGEVPELPDTLYGSYTNPPEFPFITDNVEFMISGTNLLADNDTVWQFAEPRDTREVLASYKEALKTSGWTLTGEGDTYLRMQRPDEILYISRVRVRDLLKKNMVSGRHDEKTAMVAHYSRCLDNDSTKQAMSSLLQQGTDVETLLLFRKYFTSQQLRERLCKTIQQSHFPTLEGFLLLGNYHADHSELEKGRKDLIFARAMQLAEKEPNAKVQEITNLAKKLGDKNLTEIPLDGNILRQTGFICLQDISKRIQVERGLNEPVLFYKSEGDNQIQTIALTVIQLTDSSLPPEYRLLKVERHGENSSSSESDGKIGPDGKWTSQSHLQEWADEKDPVTVDIETLENRKFVFIITPGSM